MQRITAINLVIATLFGAAAVGGLNTVAAERWDGISVCVDHKTRDIFAPTSGKCPGSSTLKRLSLEPETPEPGTKILAGSTSPLVTQGRPGDFFLDLTAAKLYGPKDVNGWPESISLRGADGSVGPQGTAGSSGAQGPAGPSGTSKGFHIEGDYVEIIADSESPQSYVSWSQVINTSRSGLALAAGNYLINFSGNATGAGYLPPSRGTCSLYSATTDADSGGYQNFEVPAGGLEYAPTVFSGAGFIELREGEYIVLDCAASYEYGQLNNMDPGYSYTWDGLEREEYIVEMSIILLDEVTYVSD